MTEEQFIERALQFVETHKDLKMSAKDFILGFYKAALLKDVVYNGLDLISLDRKRVFFYCHKTTKIYTFISLDKATLINYFSSKEQAKYKSIHIKNLIILVSPCLNQN
jgi:hypothetical protein